MEVRFLISFMLLKLEGLPSRTSAGCDLWTALMVIFKDFFNSKSKEERDRSQKRKDEEQVQLQVTFTHLTTFLTVS